MCGESKCLKWLETIKTHSAALRTDKPDLVIKSSTNFRTAKAAQLTKFVDGIVRPPLDKIWAYDESGLSDPLSPVSNSLQ